MRLRSAGFALVPLLSCVACSSHNGGGGGGAGGSGHDMAAPATGGADLAGVPPGSDLAQLASPDMAPAPYDWLQFGFDAQHSGVNPRETTITAANVATLTLKAQFAFPKLAGENGSIVDGAVVYLSGVSTAGGTRDLVFATTTAGTLYALDAVTLTQVWMKSHGPTGGACTNSHGVPCYATSEPAIDPNRKFVYSYGLDGYVHKHAVADGTETTTGGWPALVTKKPTVEKGGCNLAVASTRTGDFLYSGVGGYYGDAGDYQGHVTTIKLADGTQKVFNTLCSNQTTHFVLNGTPDCTGHRESAVWARSGVAYRPDDDRIYFATGNGEYVAAMFLWGDTVLAINADGGGTATGPLDAWTPADQNALNSADADVGSTAPAFLPVPAGSKYMHIALQGNKVPSGKTAAPMRILNLDDLSGMGGPGHLGGELFDLDVPQGNEILTQPAVWVNPADNTTWVFVANDSGISGLRLVPDGGTGTPSLTKVWTSSVGGSSPVVANGVLFYVSDNAGMGGTNQVYALDPVGAAGAAKVLWQADLKALTGAAVVGGVHWEGVIVAHGRVYVTSEHGNSAAGTADGLGFLSMFALP